ncbi:MAG: response regulator transcription factor [Pseudomonadota bacterium]
MKALVIEDDERVLNYIAKGLREAGHIVDTANNGKDGLFLASTENYDAIVLDWMLPLVDGIKLVNALRASDQRTPVLMLSSRSDVSDRVTGLRSGVDDYLVKPFAFDELLARLELLATRRTLVDSGERVLVCGDLELNVQKRSAKRAGVAVNLNPREYALLEFLMRNKNKVMTRTMLLENVWDYHFDPQTNVIDVHMSRLRGKIDAGFDSALLRTIRGSGYMISDE